MKTCSVFGCNRPHTARNYCDTHYRRFKKHGDPHIKNNKGIKIKFEVDENGCFNCTSHSVNQNGYPRIGRNGRGTSVHRFVYKNMFGDVPENIVIRHKCDNRKCINPEHLEPGSHYDNYQDMIKRGRRAHLKGESNGMNKLTDEQVLEIRKKRKTGVPVSELSKEYNTSGSNVYRIINYELWSHLKTEDKVSK